jgi:hypothetical protein
VGIVGLRREDVLVTSFPKSGNTWIRFFFCNVISQLEWGGKAVDFRTMDETMPELGVHNLLKPWPYRSIPRIVKTHWRFLPIFIPRRSILVIRDPRDVMVSYYDWELAKKEPRYTGDFTHFVRHERFGIESWFRHFQSWRSRATVVVKYEDLRQSDVEVFTRIADRVGISLDRETILASARGCSLGRVRALEDKYGQTRQHEFKGEFRFTGSGQSEKWKGRFCREDLDYYQVLREKYGLAEYR